MRNDFGEKSSAWKGDKVGYFAMHEWLRKMYPPPEKCTRCDKKTKWLDLANITGVYERNIKNFKYLCKSCHNTQDKKYKYFGKYADIKGDTHLYNLGGKNYNRKKIKLVSKYPGVTKNQRSPRYNAKVLFKGIRYYLGTFDTAKIAHEAYKQKIKELVGV